MKYILTILSLSITFNCFSQGKVKLGKTPLNQTLPQDLTNRVFWAQTDIFKFNIAQLAGSIIVSDDSLKNFSRGPRIIKSTSPLQVNAVQNGLRYHAKVDKGFNSDLKFLIFSAGISQDQIVDVKITDLLYVLIDYDKVPIDSLIKVSKLIKSSGKKYYIQGVLLTSIDEQYNSKVSTNGSIVGNVFGASGKIYHEDDKFTEDFRLSLTLIDLDKLVFFTGTSNLSNSNDVKRSMQASTIKTPQVIKITGFK